MQPAESRSLHRVRSRDYRRRENAAEFPIPRYSHLRRGCVVHAAYVTVDLNPPLGQGQPRSAYFTVEYEGTPWGWTVNIGDSPTNDGYGGNSGGPEHAAEVQVLNQQLTVYNDPKIPGQVDSMLNQQLSLTNGSLKFGIANEAIAVGQPRTVLATPVTKTLFQAPDSNLASNDPLRSVIYAGFNRVVSGRPDRYGCGARSVTIWTGTGSI